MITLIKWIKTAIATYLDFKRAEAALKALTKQTKPQTKIKLTTDQIELLTVCAILDIKTAEELGEKFGYSVSRLSEKIGHIFLEQVCECSQTHISGCKNQMIEEPHYICNRREGHAGPHSACTNTEHKFVEWEDGE